MPIARKQADVPDTEPRHHGRGFLFWAMLAAIVVLAVAAAVAFNGWNTALRRADMQAERADRLRAAADDASALQAQVVSLRKDLGDEQAGNRVLQTRLAEGRAALADLTAKATVATQEAAAAQAAEAGAERARAEAQAKQDAALPTPPPARAGLTSPQPASNSSGATIGSDIAPALPLPGLPPGATPRDYLVAAQQAVRQGENGRAQSALEHAETRLLNRASLAGTTGRSASHPGVAEIEHALDQLGAGDTNGVLQTIDGLLSRP